MLGFTFDQLYNFKNRTRIRMKSMRCSNDKSLIVCTVLDYVGWCYFVQHHTDHPMCHILPKWKISETRIVHDPDFKKIFGLSSAANSAIRISNVCASQKWLSSALKHYTITQQQTTPSNFHQTRLQSHRSFHWTTANHNRKRKNK